MLAGSTSGDDKGKQKAIGRYFLRSSQLFADPDSSDVSSSDYSDSSDASASTSESEGESSSESDEEITQEYLDMLLQQARQNAAAAEAERIPFLQDDEILTLDDVEPPCVSVFVQEICQLDATSADHFHNSIQGHCQPPISNSARDEARVGL